MKLNKYRCNINMCVGLKMMPVGLLHVFCLTTVIDRSSVNEFILKGVCVTFSVYMCSDNG